MSFLFPALLAGAVFIGVPLAIHLIGRKQASSVPFGAYDFLEEVVLRLARRERIRQFLLMGLRILAVLALAIAAAGPVRNFAVLATTSHDLLLVIDTSESMSYVHDGRSLLTRAKQIAIAKLANNDAEQVMIATSGPDTRLVLAAPTADRAQARSALDGIAVADGTADIAAALRKGLEALNGRAVEVIVVSDLQRSALLGSNAFANANVVRFTLLDAAERKAPQALSNVGLLSLRSDVQSDGAFVVTVGFKSYAAEDVSTEVRITLDDSVRARGFVDLAPGAVTEKQFTLSDLGAGEHRGKVTLATTSDGYAADDSVELVIEAFTEPKILLVNGDPRSVPFRDELFYVERALQSSSPPLQTTTISHEDLAATPLAGYAVVLLANVPAPRESVARQVNDWVDQGGGLFIALGERVSFEAYNEVFGAVLPNKLRDQFALADPKSADALAQAVGLTSIDWAHPILRRFDAASEPGFTQSHTFRHFFVENPQQAAALMRFSSGVPALIEGRSPSGKGRTLLWLASLDRDFSDFAIRPVFAPFLAMSLRYLGGALRSAPEQALVEGQTVSLRAPAGADQAVLASLDGKVTLATLTGAPTPVRFTQPGAYALNVSGKRVPGSAFSVLPSTAESDFAVADAREVAARLGASESALSNQAGGDRPFEPLAHFAMLALSLAFVGQSLIARRG